MADNRSKVAMRRSIVLAMLQLMDDFTVIEIACGRAKRIGALTCEEARDIELCMDWCWSAVTTARPQLPRKGGAI